MITYPVWEVDRGLVAPGYVELGLLLQLIGGSGCGNIAIDGNTSPLEVIRDTADMEINIVHLTKLLRCLLVVAPRLGIELNSVVAVLSLASISCDRKKGGVETQRTRALL